MNSYLFSATCNNPLQGLLDFTVASKPFRTKVIEAGITIAFNESDMRVRFVEELQLDIEQQFNMHTGSCIPLSPPCWDDGFAVAPYDDGTGFEYALFSDVNGVPTLPGCDSVTTTPVCAAGFEYTGFELTGLDATDDECIATCSDTFFGPCSTPESVIVLGMLADIAQLPVGIQVGNAYTIDGEYFVWQGTEWVNIGKQPCTDRSATTLATSFTETLLIEDIELNVTLLNTTRDIAKAGLVSYHSNGSMVEMLTDALGRQILS